MRLFLILLTIISFGASGSVSNVKLDDSIATTGIETIRGSSVPIGRNKVMLPSSFDNLLLNGSYEHQNAMEGWTTTSLAVSQGVSVEALDGKKKVCVGGLGSFYQMLTDTDKFHGRKFIARLNIQNPAGREAQACLYDGEDLHKCIDIVPSTEFREYAIKDTFIEGKTFGVIITGNELDGICTDMNSVKLDKNEAYVAEVEVKKEVLIASDDTNVQSITLSPHKGTLDNSLFTIEGGVLTPKIDCTVAFSWSVSGTNATGGQILSQVSYDGEIVGLDRGYAASNAAFANASVSGSIVVEKGKPITFSVSSPAISYRSKYLTISATARSQVINYPDETFSTDINPVYWKATPCGEDEIGCYNTYSYAASSNTRTLCATRPTQTDADMRVNGLMIYTRAYAVPGTCAQPTSFKFVIGKNFSIPSINLYKNTSRTIAGNLDLYGASGSNTRGGLTHNIYNEEDGTLFLDAGETLTSSVTNSTFFYSDNTIQNNGYLVISATKNGGALVNKSPRTLVKVVEDGDDWAHIYSDGWVEQALVSYDGTATSGEKTLTLQVPFRDTKYLGLRTNINSSTSTDVSARYFSLSSKATTNFKTFIGGTSDTRYADFYLEGYGAASYLLENFGIKVGY